MSEIKHTVAPEEIGLCVPYKIYPLVDLTNANGNGIPDYSLFYSIQNRLS